MAAAPGALEALSGALETYWTVAASLASSEALLGAPGALRDGVADPARLGEISSRQKWWETSSGRNWIPKH